MLLSCGCSTQSDAITVSGQLMLDGLGTAGEILIEPLAQNDQPAPSPVTVFAGPNGRFAGSIPHDLNSVNGVPCRVVVRVPAPTDSDVPATLNEQAPPDRIVNLVRHLDETNEWHLLLTH